MDEQRIAAYIQLIQSLLECPSGTVNDIINANRGLVDANFVQVMAGEAEKMAAEGNFKAAWLQNLATQLANFIASANPHTDYLKFLREVLLAMIKSGGTPQVVYPILQQNFDKLDLQFAQILQAWTTSKFTEVASEQAASIAAVIGKLGYLINQFPMGQRAWNLEIGIACYSAASEVYTREDYPERWATVQNNLALTYSERIKGVRAENIEGAIACYREASEVYTREDYPKQWAGIQNNLGMAYSDRIEGVRAENIEEAITCYLLALDVYTRQAYPENWAMTQNNLGNAYSDRIEGVRAKNIGNCSTPLTRERDRH
ncbi:tetratricopeptide repeat protein [Microcoleus sp. Pol14C2]|uniref:hypothetical protein n=1 Tax=unclassified Microcoleus TaxID=2642155 RepID=UPI002FD1C3E0